MIGLSVHFVGVGLACQANVNVCVIAGGWGDNETLIYPKATKFTLFIDFS